MKLLVRRYAWKVAFLGVAALSACSGGGGQFAAPGAGAPPLAPTGAPPPAASQPSPRPTPPSIPANKAIVRVAVRVPASTAPASSLRRPAYVSSATKSIKIAFAAPNGSSGWEEMGLTPGSPGCSTTNGTTVCTTQFGIGTTGTVQFTISLYDGPMADPGNGIWQVSGNLLSTATQSSTIVADQVNDLRFTLSGVPASVALALAQPAPPAGPATTGIALTVAVKDASGATILGPGGYATPIALTNADASGATTLKVNGSPSAAVNAPSDAVTLDYTGLAIPPDTLTASSPAIPSATVTFAPAIQPINGVNDVTIYGIGGIGFLHPTEAGVTDHGGQLSESDTCVSIATVQNSPPSSYYWVTATNAGSCQITFSDPFGQSAVSHVGVTQTNLTIQ
jgi:hypothetical protein